MSAGTVVPFVIIPIALGTFVTLVLVNVFPAKRARDILMLMGLVFAMSIVLLLRFIQPERLLRVESMPEVTDFFATLQSPVTPLLPSFWAGEALFAGLDLRALGYACVQFVASEKATHVVLRRQGQLQVGHGQRRGGGIQARKGALVRRREGRCEAGDRVPRFPDSGIGQRGRRQPRGRLGHEILVDPLVQPADVADEGPLQPRQIRRRSAGAVAACDA